MEREKRERKLIALMLNDLEANLSPGELSEMSEETRRLPDEELRDALRKRLDLGPDTTEDQLDEALAFVEEPEVLSEKGTRDPASAPDLSHREDAAN